MNLKPPVSTSDVTIKSSQNKAPAFRPLDDNIFEQKAENVNRAEPQDSVATGREAPAEYEAAPAGESSLFKSANNDVKPKEWTVLTYFNGNCDLQDDMNKSMKALESAGSDDKINFVAQFAKGDDNGKAERILLKKPGWLGFKKNSVVMQELGKTNMAHPKSLKDFITWGMKKFPAEHYMLIINGHGMGFVGSLPDDHHDDIMLTPEFKNAMDVAVKETGKKIDVLGFDSCLMANAETAYAAKDAAKFMIASEEVLISGNWDYGQFANKMKEEADGDGLTVAEALESVVRSQHNHDLLTSSIIDCRRMPEFAKKLKTFADGLINTDDSDYAVRRAFRKAQHYCQPKILAQASNGDMNTKPMDQMRDVASVALEVIRSRDIKDVELKNAARDLAKFTVEKVVLFEMHRKGMDLGDSSGVSIYAPVSEAGKYTKFYNEKLSIAQDTGWGKVVEKFGAR